MKVRIDRDRDEATIYFGDEKGQSFEHGHTSLVLTVPAEVQLGFEGERRLIWMSVRPASLVLPPELLDQAEIR